MGPQTKPPRRTAEGGAIFFTYLPLMDFDDDCFVVIVDCCILL
jgi:hypothetical protein